MQKEDQSIGLSLFVRICKELNAKELTQTLDLILTPQEKDDIGDRMLIIRELLREKETQREMAEGLHVSIAKITRGSNALKYVDSNLKNTLRKILK